MKKFFIVLAVIVCTILFSGCASRKTEAPTLSLGDELTEQTLEETILWETVLTEQWI